MAVSNAVIGGRACGESDCYVVHLDSGFFGFVLLGRLVEWIRGRTKTPSIRILTADSSFSPSPYLYQGNHRLGCTTQELANL